MSSFHDAYAWFGVVLIPLALWLKSRPRAGVLPMHDGPILSSGNMLGTPGLQSMAKGTIAGFAYNLLTNDAGRVMFFVELGHDSQSHIIAYGDKSDLAAGPPIYNGQLENVSLEGDFPSYFHMLCNKDAQVTVREVFAPDVMAQFADFCRSYDFEIFHDTLYISRAQKATDADDQTSLTTDLTNFLTKNAEVLKRL